MEKRNEIVEVSFELALLIIEFSELLEVKRKYVIARQLMKSGTSIGANIREAQGSESKLYPQTEDCPQRGRRNRILALTLFKSRELPLSAS